VRRLLALLALLLAGSATAAAPPGVSVDGPVDLERLLQLTRLREAMTAKLVYTYTFRQTTIEEEIGPDGNVIDRQVRVYQVVPTPQGVERHLVGKDGREPTEAEVRKQERRNEQLQRRFEKMQERAQKDADRRQAARSKAAKAAPATVTPPPKPVARPAPTAATAAPPAATASPAPVPAPVTEPVAVPAPGPAEAPAPVMPPPPPERPALAPLPACDFDDPLASVRPPMPGSVTRSSAPGLTATEAARRKRERPSDYSLFELLNLTDHEYAGACTWEGRPMHVVSFRPPEGFDPLNPVERVMGAMAGAILIDGADLEVARAEGALVSPITWGAGMVKLKAARVVLEYGRLHDELWLPRRDVFEMETRVVFDNDHLRVTHEFDDFSKATVETEVEYGLPVESPE
jgi:Skp family chaperone for outer membrane proteins